jgi:purine-nucleoside phosphorylase
MQSDSEKATALIKARAGDAPIDVGIVLGFGLSAIAEQVESPQVFPYSDLPGFRLPPSEGADAQVVVGTIGTARVAIMRGRVHYYSSGDIDAMWVPLETIAQLGAKAVVLIGAAGSVKPEISPGALIAITDHINLSGLNPLIGDLDDKRFVDLTGAYDRFLRERFAVAAGEIGRKTGEGIYMWFPGPSFETPAEIRAAQALGADIVGMSLVPEVIIARRLGLRVLAISMVTNFSAGLRTERLVRDQTLRAAAASIVPLTRVLSRFLELWTLEAPKRR